MRSNINITPPPPFFKIPHQKYYNFPKGNHSNDKARSVTFETSLSRIEFIYWESDARDCDKFHSQVVILEMIIRKKKKSYFANTKVAALIAGSMTLPPAENE